MMILIISLSVFINQNAIADKLDSARQKLSKTNTVLKKSQKKINKLSEESLSINEKYKSALSETSLYNTYNTQLFEIVATQESELDSLTAQIEEIEITSKHIMPLMKDMIDTLDEFIRVDLPFLQDERTTRVNSLKENMKRSDLTVSEKYRKILEAYQIEMEYGETIETYRGQQNGKTVNFVKIGRTALFNQTLDKSISNVWHKDKQAWVLVTSQKVSRSISKAIQISLKQAPPELLTVLVDVPRGQRP